MNGNVTERKACTTDKGTCYCEKCSPGRTQRAEQFKKLHQTPIFRLPTEMLVNIVDRVDLVNFPNFLIACFHLFRQRGIVPSYPTEMLQTLLLREEEGKIQSPPHSLQTMPLELILAISQTLDTHEKIHMILATYCMRKEEIKLITHQP
ncbi:MAG: hypothetical protein L6R40_004038 [Gallowayella cf. fulva]|nr:MAG: hypothetical protein L6R40_004038 [Xanthomendoza cf. fulva]